MLTGGAAEIPRGYGSATVSERLGPRRTRS
jgi:hypothetical protein